MAPEENERKIKPQIPLVVLERLALYHFLLQDWIISGRTEPVTSKEISICLNLTDETVRRDLSFLDTNTGKPGVGYDPNDLFNVIGDRLALEARMPVIIVGSARMVDALLSIFSLEKFGFVPEGFFSENPGDSGKLFRGFKIKLLSELTKENIPPNVRLGIIATHPDWTQFTIDTLARAGIKGILNITPTVVTKIPKGVELIQLRYPCYLKILAFKTSGKFEL